MRLILGAPARTAAAFFLALGAVGGLAAAQTAEPTPDATAVSTMEATAAATADATAAATPEATEEPNVGRQDFTVDLGDFQTPTELTYPPNGTGPFPTIVLIHGSGPADMDFTMPDQSSGQIVSHIFRDIALNLPQHGYAVVRYNKHYVSSYGQVDWQKYAALDTNQLKADAQKVVTAIQSNPLVDSQQIFIYGWSEGSLIGSALVAENPSAYKGLILQGPVTVPWRPLLEAQINNISVPYIESFAQGGKITADDINKAIAGNGGLVAREILSALASDPSQLPVTAVSPTFDTNKDGVISVVDELPQGVTATLDAMFGPGGYMSQYTPDKALPPVTDQAAKLTLPVLILQGERDGNVSPTGALDLAGKLAAAGNHDFHVVLYPTLGHTLGEVDNPTVDNFPPIAPQPLADTVAWLNKLTGLNPVGEATATPAP